MSDGPSKGELKKNLKLLKERLEEHPMDLDARMRMARTYRLLDKRTDAVAHYAAVARYLSLAGHPLQAIAVLKELLQVDPKHEETLLFLAKLYARTRAADATNRGRVAVPILEPGADPHNNLRFLAFSTAVIRAVSLHQGLLRATVASAGNDHRLGANEAPPAIISVYLGSTLGDVFEQLAKTGEATSSKKGNGQQPKSRLRRFAVHPAGKVLLALTVCGFSAGLIVFSYYYYKYAQLTEEKLLKGPFTNTSKLFGTAQAVGMGDMLDPEEVAAALRRAGYSESRSNRLGWYQVKDDTIEIYPGSDSYFQQEAGLIRFTASRGV